MPALASYSVRYEFSYILVTCEDDDCDGQSDQGGGHSHIAYHC